MRTNSMACLGMLCGAVCDLIKCYFIYVLFIIVWKVCLCLRNHVVSKIWKVDLKSRFGDWAVVTGCTDGIGKAYCHELAKRGINLILISRTLSKLKDAASDIEKTYGVETEIIQADFSKGFEIYEDVGQKLRGRTNIGMLVNNVGLIIDEPKSFESITQGDIFGGVTVNMAAPTYLTNIVLPSMIENKKGAVINISSLAGITPYPFFGIYSPTKAYNYFFSEVLKEEMRAHGIYVQTVTPSFVATSMTKYSEMIDHPSLTSPSPETFAASAVSTIGYADVTCGYAMHELSSILLYLLPQWMSVKFSARIQKHFIANLKKKE